MIAEPVVENATAPPDAIKLLPAASIAWTVSITVSSVVTEAEETLMVEVVSSAAPIANATVGLPVVIPLPLMVAVMVTVSRTASFKSAV